MANDFPNLLVYTPITGDNTFVEDIAPIATDYSHTIRLLGGYWTASWKLYKDDMRPATWDQWRTNRQFYHFREEYRGQTTWEGSIETIQPDDDKKLLDITAFGYVHSIQNQYNSTTDSGTTDASAWLNLMRATDCEFIPGASIRSNTLQCYKAGTDKVWTEMLKVVELGDGSTYIPWQLGVYKDRRLHYKPVSTTPIGYVRGGVRWRVDMTNELCNKAIVRYDDETGTPQTDLYAQITESQRRYGIREERLERSRIPTASAAALAAQYLIEHAWPYMRAIGCGRNIQVYDSIGANSARAPWLILPGVFRDTTIISGNTYYLSWLEDPGDFLVDEVVASAAGVQLRTSKWTESDAIEAYMDYLGDAPKTKDKQAGRRKKGAGTGGSGSKSTGSGGTTGGTTGTGGSKGDHNQPLPD